MQKRTLGPFEVHAIGLGCMNMSQGYGVADDATSERLLNEALDVGYDFLDTALVYGSGHNETLIGKAVGKRRNDYVLATKCGLSRDGIDGSPRTLTESCDASLKRLQTDVIDLYYLHRVDPKVPIEESVGAMARLVEAGKVRTIGLSEVCRENLERAHREHPITALQSEYSLWTRTPERAVLDACAEHGITFVPFSPLGRQFLTGKSPGVADLPDNDLRCTIGRPRFEGAAFEKNCKLLEPFADIARTNNCSMAQLALAWLLAVRDRTLIPIPGTKHIDYMKENFGALQVELSAETVAELDQLINESTVVGERYTADRMATTDSERD